MLLKKPTGQSRQKACPSAFMYEPGSHCTQPVGPASAILTEYDPMGHLKQSTRPVVLVKNPELHSLQAGCPSVLIADPEGHAVHDERPVLGVSEVRKVNMLGTCINTAQVEHTRRA